MPVSPDLRLYASTKRREDKLSGDKLSLLAFTLSSQIAVGMFVSAAVAVTGSNGSYHTGGGDTLLATITAASFALFLVGLLISAAHVARPLLFPSMARNWRSSWLSREGVVAPVFLALLFVFFFVFYPAFFLSLKSPYFLSLQSSLNAASLYLSPYLILTAIVGVAFIVAQARIYRLESRPSWNHPYTVISFFATSTTAGPLAVTVLLVVEAWRGTTSGFWAPFLWLSGAVSLLLIVTPLQLFAMGAYLASLKKSGQEARVSYEIQTQKLRRPLAARVILSAIVLGVSAATLVSGISTLPTDSVEAISLVLFSCVFLAELLGRYIFYYGVVPLNPPARYADILG